LLEPMGKSVTLSWDALYGSLVAIAIAIGTAYASGYRTGRASGKILGRQEKARELNESTERERYLRLYVPLKRLFGNCFLTTSRLILYPKLSQRVKRAFRFLMRGRLKMSATALSDTGFSEGAEFECGSAYPSDQIERLISDNLDIADQELQSLAGALRRKQFDDHLSPSNADDYPWERVTTLSKQELSLLRYIYSEYDKLNARFSKPT
jgi:hypothetical protein